ncbi:MAG: DUF4248 domain-containing protein [Bacteroidales bacterium]|nr:DUF4248 domain-containing protein [Bacteroidales bacterium]
MKVITLHKNELARLCGVTTRTISVWLNIRYYEDLKKLGYTKSQKVLLPQQVTFIIGKLDIDTND